MAITNLPEARRLAASTARGLGKRYYLLVENGFYHRIPVPIADSNPIMAVLETLNRLDIELIGTYDATGKLEDK